MRQVQAIRGMAGALIGLLFVVGTGLANSASVGTIEVLEGRAKKVSAQNLSTRLEKGSTVAMGDKIMTGRTCKLQIRFADKSSIILGSRAELIINKFIYKAGDKSSTCDTSLTRGSFKAIGGAISKMAPDQMRIKTATATIGIRGTECIAFSTASSLTVIYTEGNAISVSNDRGQTVLTGEVGMGCETLKGEAPGQPRKYSMREMNRIMRNVTMRVVGHAVRGAQHSGARSAITSSRSSHH